MRTVIQLAACLDVTSDALDKAYFSSTGRNLMPEKADERPHLSINPICLPSHIFRSRTQLQGEFMLMFVEQIVDIIVQCSLARHIVALCRVIHSMPSTAMTSNATVSFITVTVLSFT